MFPGEGLAIFEAVQRSGIGVKKESRKPTERRNGTSFATPIAAGTAAMVLDLIRQMLKDSEEVERRFKTVEGMSDIFLAMSGDSRDGGYHHVRPWTVLGQGTPRLSPHKVNETHKWFTFMKVLGIVERFGYYPDVPELP